MQVQIRKGIWKYTPIEIHTSTVHTDLHLFTTSASTISTHASIFSERVQRRAAAVSQWQRAGGGAAEVRSARTTNRDWTSCVWLVPVPALGTPVLRHRLTSGVMFSYRSYLTVSRTSSASRVPSVSSGLLRARWLPARELESLVWGGRWCLFFQVKASEEFDSRRKTKPKKKKKGPKQTDAGGHNMFCQQRYLRDVRSLCWQRPLPPASTFDHGPLALLRLVPHWQTQR